MTRPSCSSPTIAYAYDSIGALPGLCLNNMRKLSPIWIRLSNCGPTMPSPTS